MMDYREAFMYGLLQEFSTADIVYYIVMYALGIVCYFLRAIGMYSIAKRRGIANAWLAWIPVAWVWVLGSISDQFRYVTKAQVKRKRVTLLVLNIINAIGCIALLAIVGVQIADLISLSMADISEEVFLVEMMSMLFQMLGMSLVLMGVALAQAIVLYIAMYDLFLSVNPSNAVLFLVLSIFISYTNAFFIFFNRRKDTGMPPRCDVPQEPVTCTEPSYIPAPSAPVEPWENNTEE